MRERVRREPPGSTIPTPRFARHHSTWTLFFRTGGTDSQNGMMENPRHPISDLHLGKFPDSVDLQSGKVTFKTEVCANSSHLTITISWIKEVEIAKSIDELMTSQSTTWRRDFSGNELLEAKIASALKKDHL